MTKRKAASARIQRDWLNEILPVAREIAESYDTPVTLRQLFYRLVSLPHDHPGWLRNTRDDYGNLSRVTAAARRHGRFPDLADQSSRIVEYATWGSPSDAIKYVRGVYRRDRTEGQDLQLWLGVEKVGLKNQMQSWFGDMGIPIIPLGGQCSQTFADRIRHRVQADGRPAILLYAGDHDPSGWVILQSFVDRTGCWDNPELAQWNPDNEPANRGRRRNAAPIEPAYRDIPNFNLYRKFRVALTPEQCDEYDLVRNPAKKKDPNTDNFMLTFKDTLTDNEIDDGLGVQVEVDALDPNDLRQLFEDAVAAYWDDDAYDKVIRRETRERSRLAKLADQAAPKNKR